MKKEWKNYIKVLGYLVLIMLLLFSSLPLSGVFAEDEINQSESESEIQESATEQIEEEKIEENETEAPPTEENTIEEQITESVEEDNTEESLIPLDSYLFSGNETVTVTGNDGDVTKQGKGFERTYFVTLNNYHDCTQNLEENHFLQASYIVCQGNHVIQSGTLMLGSVGGDSFQIEYAQTGEYMVEIKASAYEERNQEYVWIADKSLGVITDSIEKITLPLEASIEKEGHFSYREDYGRSVALSLFMKGFESESDGDMCYTVSSNNEAVIRPASGQKTYFLHHEAARFDIMGVGQAELTIQPMEHTFYTIEKLVIPITVKNSAMQDEDYSILYTDADGTETVYWDDFGKWQEFLEQKKNWLNGSVSIRLSEAGEQYYAGFGAAVNQEINVTTEEKLLFLSNETPVQQYDFWCSNLQKNTTTKEDHGIRTFVAGIDKTAPESAGITYNQNFYKPTSTETIKYYGENFVVSGSFQDMLSGVEMIEYTTQADLGAQAKWKPIQSIKRDGMNATFELSLEHGCFTGIAFRATDIAGNTSETVEIRDKTGRYLTIIVDKQEPILTIMSKTVDEKAYSGKWTNKPISISVQESMEHIPLSGIQNIQYQYVSIGSEYQPEKWEEFPIDGLLNLGHEETAKTDQNGTYYFRATTNTGIVTAVKTQMENAIRIRLQQTLPEKEDIIEEAPKLEQNQTWYNKKSGVPLIKFAYPQYDNGVISLEYDAPLTIHTRLTTKHGRQEEMSPVYKTATIGIRNDNIYQQLCAGEKEDIKDNLEELAIDFFYDKKTGYATDGIFQLEYWISDAAGNESEHEIYDYHIDTHEPEELEVLIEGVPMEEDTSKTIVFERFYQSAVSGSVSADFGISGKGAIKLMVAEAVGDWENNQKWIQGDSFLLSPCTSGCIYMLAEDAAGNQSILRTHGIVVDNQPPTGENGGKFISIATKPNENNFYNKDVELKLSASDLPQSKGFSSLESFSCVIGTADKENGQRIELFSFTKALPSKEELSSAQSCITTELIDAAVFEGNDTYVEITATDRCGNIAISREELKIDITAPKIEITFDQNEAQNDYFYQTPRTATIQVEELNFDSQELSLEITRDGEPYILYPLEWQSDGSKHWTMVSFTEDGDYTMVVSCADLADNISKEVSVEPFTIDLTKPVIEITYDNNTANNNVYFQTTRTAYITVKEHNFREEDFRVTAEPTVLMGAWSHEGDEHCMKVSFLEDNHYHFNCACTDLAGNEAEQEEEQDFYIDSIPPQIVIRGVEDGSANAGEIYPIVFVYDTNHNKDAVDITVTTGIGEMIPLAIQMQEQEQGYSYFLTDVSEKEDNVYFLQVKASDMAGNQNKLTYRFSLNRNGSTYDLTQISQITERVYNRSTQLSDIIILEMNVDEIEDYSIYITRNGRMLSCRETQERPQADTDKNEICYYVEESGNEQTGYSNRYFFYQENFVKEGIYRITCYSKDRAGNEMNNTLEEKQAELSFIVDNTVPKVVIDGIEEGGIYNEESKIVHIMVQDNFKLKEACFTLVNQTGEELQSWDYMELADKPGDTITITIPSLEEKQSLIYRVSDAAGNELVLLPDSKEAPTGFLITTNPWLQFISSPIKVAGSICVVVSILGTGVVIWYRKG